MTREQGDPYVISQPLDILAVLEGLLSRRALIRLDVPGHRVSIVSALLQVDRQADVIILDSAARPELDAPLLRAPAVRVQGLLDGVTIEFSGALSAARHEGCPAFSMVRPAQIRRIQRREDFRIDVPASSSAACVIRDHILPGGEARFSLINLSAGGVHLADTQGLLAQVPVDTIFEDCALVLPDAGRVAVRLQLLRGLRSATQAAHATAFRFFELPANRQVTIQQFVGALERAATARRRGTE